MVDLNNLNQILHIAITVLNILTSILFFGLVFYSSCKNPADHMPKHLKIYFMICIYLWGFLTPIFSIISGIYYLVTLNNNTNVGKVLRFILIISTQQIRVSYLVIIIGRIFSTLFYKNYAKHPSFGRSMVLIVFAFTASFINGIIEFWRIFIDSTQFAWYIYIVVVTHIITLILCKALFSINQAKYKTLAYQSSLAHRHQIYENVKTLKIIGPVISIFSLVASLGPLAVMIYKLTISGSSPPALFYLSYNISFVIMMIWNLKNPTQNMQGINAIGQTLPLKPDGKSKPTIAPQIIPVDKYFDDLKLQWK